MAAQLEKRAGVRLTTLTIQNVNPINRGQRGFEPRKSLHVPFQLIFFNFRQGGIYTMAFHISFA